MDINKYKKYINQKNKKVRIPKFINKILFTTAIFLITIIVLKTNNSFRQVFYEKFYNNNINFASINKIYQKYFGSPIPFDIFKDNTKTVFNEKLKYENKNIYLNGVKLQVDNNYLVPSLDNGIVIFVGEKEGYNKTVIIECENGLEVWYGNIENFNVKMYDYISKGSLIGEVNSELYLVFMKDGKVMNYEDYI